MRLLGTRRSRNAGRREQPSHSSHSSSNFTSGLRRAALLLLFIMTICDVMAFTFASTSTEDVQSGYARLRHRAHRKRHRHKLPVDELAELVEMKAAEEEEVQPQAVDNSNKRSRREYNEPLCATERFSRELNTHEWEYDPPFIVEVKCRNAYDYDMGVTDKLEEQTCVHGILRCVQHYSEVHTVRRSVHSSDWQSHVVQGVPTACECMWPIDKYGRQEL